MPVPTRTWSPHDRPLVIAHRGGAALAPENTVLAFEQAVALGADMLETDVQLTADGHAVAFHDDTMDRVTNLTGPIRSFTLAQVRGAAVYGPDGQVGQIPTIAELLDAFPDARWAIDVKNGDSIVPLAQAINATGTASHVCVAHAWDSWLDGVRELTSEKLERSLGWEGLARLVAHAKAGTTPPASFSSGAWVHIGWQPAGFSLMSSAAFADRMISMCHEMGMGVRVWTINREDRMRRLLDQGVDGIFTDRPDRLLSLRGA